MDAVLGLFGALLRTLAACSVCYAIGSVVLKILTWGRYPRLRRLPDDARQGFPEFEIVALFGLLCLIALVVLLARNV